MTQSKSLEKTEANECRYCRAAMPVEAMVCQTCQRSQSVLLNRIGPISTTIGILAFVLAALTFIGDKVSDVFFSEASMQVIKVAGDEPVIVNTGDYPVLVEQSVTTIPDLEHQITTAIDRVVSPKTDSQAQRMEQTGAGYAPASSFRSEFVFLRLTPEQIEKSKEAEALDFFLLVMSAESSSAKTILEEHPKATYFKGTTTVTGIAWETGDKLSQTVKVVAFPCFEASSYLDEKEYEIVNPASMEALEPF